MASVTRSVISGLAALGLEVLALAMLWMPMALTTRWANSDWWVFLLWIVAAPAGLLLAGAWVVARATVHGTFAG